MDNTIQDFLFTKLLWYMSQYSMIYKYGKRTRQLKLKIKRKLKNYPSRNNSGENRCALELNEKEVIELFENATLCWEHAQRKPQTMA